MSNTILENKSAIIEQWKTALSSGIMPVFEFELKGGDYLIVDLYLVDSKEGLFLEFSFDSDGMSSSFDEIINAYSDNYYSLKINLEYINNLDTVLEYISDNITEGYIIPNGLYE